MNRTTSIGLVLTAAILAGCANQGGLPMAAGGTATPTAAGTTAAAPATPGCKSLGPTREQATIGGAVIGGLAGALVGSQVSNKSSVGARNGALLGALVGGLAGSQMGSSVKTTQMPDGSVKLDIPGSVLFPSGSFAVSDGFKPTLDTISRTVREYCNLTAQVVGHTDSVGRRDDNKTLSVNRARAVVGYLVSTGIPASTISFDGMGQDQPVADNSSDAGRQQNRRVEIFVRPPVN
jgi:outer membrane protein OmpA-like peptidoglycan-associated protein